jgi:hypothetical protein
MSYTDICGRTCNENTERNGLPVEAIEALRQRENSLSAAVAAGDTDQVCQILSEWKANAELRGPEEGDLELPLGNAISTFRSDIVKILVENGARYCPCFNSTIATYKVPEPESRTENYLELLDSLYEKGWDVNAIDNTETPIILWVVPYKS